MAINQKSSITFSGGALINGLPVSSAAGQPVVHEQLTPLIGGLVYQATWNAATNSPALPTAAAANRGFYWVVGTAGTTSIGGITDWAAGDWVVSNGTGYDKVDNSEAAAQAASDTAAGIVELATDAETTTGTSTTLATTPAGVAAAIAAAVPAATDALAGRVELATVAETTTGTDTARAVTPAGVAAAIAAIPAVAAASATVAGIAELATDAEAIAGTDTGRTVTPANVAAVLAGRSFSATFGGSAANTITHNLGSQDVTWVLRDASTHDEVGADIQATSVNTVTVTFATAPAANSHRITIKL